MTNGTLRKEMALLPARISLGATMLYHGASKLRGEGTRQTGEYFEQVGIKPGRRWAKLTGLAEVCAGASAILGFGTRLAALAVIGTQAVAISKVHGGKGFGNQAGGFEFNLALIAVALGLLVAGPGSVSAHGAIERRLEGRGRMGLLRRRRRQGALVAGLLG